MPGHSLFICWVKKGSILHVSLTVSEFRIPNLQFLPFSHRMYSCSGFWTCISCDKSTCKLEEEAIVTSLPNHIRVSCVIHLLYKLHLLLTHLHRAVTNNLHILATKWHKWGVLTYHCRGRPFPWARCRMSSAHTIAVCSLGSLWIHGHSVLQSGGRQEGTYGLFFAFLN